MSDYTHKIPRLFQELREQWQGEGGVIPFTCKLGSVTVTEMTNSVFYLGKIRDRELVIHVEKISETKNDQETRDLY